MKIIVTAATTGRAGKTETEVGTTGKAVTTGTAGRTGGKTVMRDARNCRYYSKSRKGRKDRLKAES